MELRWTRYRKFQIKEQEKEGEKVNSYNHFPLIETKQYFFARDADQIRFEIWEL